MSDEALPGTIIPDPPTDPKEPPLPPKEIGASAKVLVAEGGIQIRNLEDLLRFARVIVEGGAAPEWAFAGIKDDGRGDPNALKKAAGAIAVAVQAGLEHGLGLLGGLQAFIVIDGNITWKAKAAAAKIRNSGVCVPGTLDFWCEGEGENKKGVAVAWRVGDPGLKRREFTFAQARKANLLGKYNWKTYDERMYQARALGFLATDLFSDVLGGFPLSEEAQDFQPRQIAPTERAAMLPPPKPDPLMAAIGAVEFASHSEVEIPEAPYPTHAEADRAIAEQEG